MIRARPSARDLRRLRLARHLAAHRARASTGSSWGRAAAASRCSCRPSRASFRRRGAASSSMGATSRPCRRNGGGWAWSSSRRRSSRTGRCARTSPTGCAPGGRRARKSSGRWASWSSVCGSPTSCRAGADVERRRGATGGDRARPGHPAGSPAARRADERARSQHAAGAAGRAGALAPRAGSHDLARHAQPRRGRRARRPRRHHARRPHRAARARSAEVQGRPRCPFVARFLGLDPSAIAALPDCAHACAEKPGECTAPEAS